MKTAVVTGGGGPAGRATVGRLLSEGYEVHALDARAESLDELAAQVESSGLHTAVVDLLDIDATRAWASQLSSIDMLAHLVGGWRGGKTFADNTVADADLLFSLLVRTLQTVTLSCHDALVAAPAGRFVIVSATAVDKPTAGGAGYAAAKAAAEAWTRSLAASFTKHQDETHDPAAIILVMKALLTDAMRAEKPDAKFEGYTHADDLAAAIAGLAGRLGSEINGARIGLSS